MYDFPTNKQHLGDIPSGSQGVSSLDNPQHVSKTFCGSSKNNDFFIDSHCHLDYYDNPTEIIHKALEANVRTLLTIATRFDTTEKVRNIAEKHENVWATVGIHPCDVEEMPSILWELFSKNPNPPRPLKEQWDLNHSSHQQEMLLCLRDWLVEQASHPKIVGFGETGLDFFRTTDPALQCLQILCFEAHIQAALITNLPLVIHTRQAAEETLAVLGKYFLPTPAYPHDSTGTNQKVFDTALSSPNQILSPMKDSTPPQPDPAHPSGTNAGTNPFINQPIKAFPGVIHCFTQSSQFACQAIQLGFLISFSGILTFKNSQDLQKIAKDLSLDTLLIETDAPFLAPIPHRGQTNRPDYVIHTADYLANLKGVSLQTIQNQTTHNFFKVFSKASYPILNNNS
jgi:TatD DNase family protein